MRKIFAVCLIAIIVASNLVSQNYGDYLQKAKDCEKNNNYFEAFAYYYDALAVGDDSEDLSEARTRFYTLKKQFESGKPGLQEKYGEFELYDGYDALLKNADKYWTEHFEEVFVLGIICERESLDYKTKTGNYLVKYFRSTSDLVDGLYSGKRYNEMDESLRYIYDNYWRHHEFPDYSNKWHELMNPVNKGLQEVRKEDWEEIGTYSDTDTYETTGVALISDNNRKEPTYRKSFCISFQIAICDLDGNELLSTDFFDYIPKEDNWTWDIDNKTTKKVSSVPLAVLTAIDEGNVTYKVKDISLKTESKSDKKLVGNGDKVSVLKSIEDINDYYNSTSSVLIKGGPQLEQKIGLFTKVDEKLVIKGKNLNKEDIRITFNFYDYYEKLKFLSNDKYSIAQDGSCLSINVPNNHRLLHLQVFANDNIILDTEILPIRPVVEYNDSLVTIKMNKDDIYHDFKYINKKNTKKWPTITPIDIKNKIITNVYDNLALNNYYDIDLYVNDQKIDYSNIDEHDGDIKIENLEALSGKNIVSISLNGEKTVLGYFYNQVEIKTEESEKIVSEPVVPNVVEKITPTVKIDNFLDNPDNWILDTSQYVTAEAELNGSKGFYLKGNTGPAKGGDFWTDYNCFGPELSNIIKGKNFITFKVKGDGNKYRLNVTMTSGARYYYEFSTKKGKETEVKVPLSKLVYDQYCGAKGKLDLNSVEKILFSYSARSYPPSNEKFEITVTDIDFN